MWQWRGGRAGSTLSCFRAPAYTATSIPNPSLLSKKLQFAVDIDIMPTLLNLRSTCAYSKSMRALIRELSSMAICIGVRLRIKVLGSGQVLPKEARMEQWKQRR